MKNTKMTVCLTAAVLLMAAGQGYGEAQRWFNDGQTHDISNLVYATVYVDNMATGMQSTVNLLDGGKLGKTNFTTGSLCTYNNAIANISGGRVDGVVQANNNSRLTMSSGSVGGDLYSFNSSQLTMSGGTIGGQIIFDELAILTLEGSNFAIDGTPIGLGEIKSVLGGDYSNEPYRTLTGTLANGDILNKRFQIGNDATIVLVPEPATLALLGLGGMLLRKR
jgi:hypothetical protein